MDDDKRRLRLYQERYLADGDLHSDGPGRARRFRWKNIGTFTGWVINVEFRAATNDYFLSLVIWSIIC